MKPSHSCVEFEFILVSSLPALAWCARFKNGVGKVHLFHGPDVEIRSDASVEGAWDDEFARFNFLEASVLCGTGGQAEDARIRLTGSTDRMSPLFSMRASGFLYVSNSLVFVLSAAGETPDPIYPYYGYDLVRIWRQGLHCLHGTFPLSSQRKLGIHFNGVLSVDIESTLTVKPHHPGPTPREFGDYHEMISESVKKVFLNAQASERKRSYRSLAAISRGYDSTATTILAREAGCRDTFTFKDSRQADPGRDSGLANAKRLGMNCRELDRWSFTEQNAVLAEFSMFGMFCATPLAGLEDELKGRILVSGYFGDTIWWSGQIVGQRTPRPIVGQ